MGKFTLTTCTAATPHAALRRRTRSLNATASLRWWPRPDDPGRRHRPCPRPRRACSGSQSEFPVKSASGGYSNALGAQLGVVFGTPWNQTGGALRNWLTGRPAAEFRGGGAGVGWIQERGTPLEPRITYGAPGLVDRGFYIDDAGRNVREIRTNLDGSAIDDTRKSVVRTANRIHLGALDLGMQAFHASDAAVYSEFFIDQPIDELPETSAYLPADDNHRGGRDSLQPQRLQLPRRPVPRRPLHRGVAGADTGGSRSRWPRRRGKRQSSGP